MNIHKVEITNFLSFKKAHFKLSDRGLCLIVGYNNDTIDATDNGDTKSSNGSGKSALISSVLWALYGNLDRSPDRKDNVINRDEKKYCCVTVYFDNCIVSRGRKPDFLRMWIDGEEITKGTSSDTQQLIESHIGMPFEVFKNSYVLSGDTVASFMNKSRSQRREFIEKMFKLTDFDDYLNRTRMLLKQQEQAFVIKTSTFENKKEQHNKLVIKKSALEGNFNNWNETKDAVLENYRKDIAELDKYNIVEAKAILEEVEKIKQEKNAKNYDVKSFKEINKKLYGVIVAEKKKQLPEICPTCKQSISDYAHYKKSIDESTHVKEQEIQENNEKINAAISVIKKLDEQIDKKTNIVYTMLDRMSIVDILHKKDVCKEKIRSLELGQNPYSVALENSISELTSLANEINDLDNATKEMKNDLEKLSICEKLFGYDGIRNIFLRNVINLLNRNIDTFLQYLSPKEYLPFEFDEDITDKIGNYSTMSQGERRRVDVAIAISLMQIMSAQHSCNILFLDELLDKLDPVGIEAVIDLLKTKCRDMSTVFLVSHNSESKNFLDEENVLTIVKQNGVSVIKGDKITHNGETV
jgi:DNA repair exonuclease SbcCD ATPase subunit